MKAKAAATIPAGEFKTHCLTLMKKVQATGEPLVITNRGNPMVRMIREEPTAPTPYFFGVSKGQATLLGDIMAPLDEPWEAYDGILPD